MRISNKTRTAESTIPTILTVWLLNYPNNIKVSSFYYTGLMVGLRPGASQVSQVSNQ
jgi:hypothetical protein